MQLKTEINRKILGEEIRKERKRNGYTQKELSDKMGITAHYVSRIERGKAVPSLAFIMKFTEIMQCDCNILLFGRKHNPVYSVNVQERV